MPPDGRDSAMTETLDNINSAAPRRPLALVTGASSGIGLELARQFAEHGFDLLICAEDEAIESARTDLAQHGTQVDSLQADLATDEGVERLVAAAAGREVDALVLNAGFGNGGAFLEIP